METRKWSLLEDSEVGQSIYDVIQFLGSAWKFGGVLLQWPSNGSFEKIKFGRTLTKSTLVCGLGCLGLDRSSLRKTLLKTNIFSCLRWSSKTSSWLLKQLENDFFLPTNEATKGLPGLSTNRLNLPQVPGFPEPFDLPAAEHDQLWRINQWWCRNDRIFCCCRFSTVRNLFSRILDIEFVDFLVGFGSQQLVHQHDVATCGHFFCPFRCVVDFLCVTWSALQKHSPLDGTKTWWSSPHCQSRANAIHCCQERLILSHLFQWDQAVMKNLLASCDAFQVGSFHNQGGEAQHRNLWLTNWFRMYLCWEHARAWCSQVIVIHDVTWLRSDN